MMLGKYRGHPRCNFCGSVTHPECRCPMRYGWEGNGDDRIFFNSWISYLKIRRDKDIKMLEGDSS